MKLAIKGHSTRGAEVIEILEMLGGINADNLYGDDTYYYYYITDDEEIDAVVFKYSDDEACIFSLEEFLEKFPYKVGDKVIDTKTDRVVEIYKAHWSETNNRTYYDVKCFDNTGYVRSHIFLQPYKEEIMEEKLMPRIDFAGYCKDKYIIDLGDYEIKEENGKTYAVRKQPQYPKTYEECCKVLGADPSRIIVLSNRKDIIHEENKHCFEMYNLYQLLICRDTYWKIAGEEMGLGKPWEPYWTIYKHKFCLGTDKDKIIEECVTTGNRILAFPTAEMRNAFFDNFKDLIEIVKELL